MSEFEPATQDQFRKIEDLANHLLESRGTENDPLIEGGLETKSAIFTIGKSALVGDAKPNTLPTLEVTQPVEENSNALWDYEITYGMQDADQSLHLLIGEDKILGTHGVLSYYNETEASDMLSAQKADKLIEDLNAQANNLK